MKKLRLLRFPSFRYGPIHKIEILKIVETFLSLQILTLLVTSDLKQAKKMNLDKN